MFEEFNQWSREVSDKFQLPQEMYEAINLGEAVYSPDELYE